jgi:hypothetical protein
MAHNNKSAFRNPAADNNRNNDSASWRQAAAEFDEHRSSEAFGAKAHRRNRRERKLDDKRNPYR